MNQPENDVPADAVAVYSEHVTVISDLKKAQWQATNYIMLILIGLVLMPKEVWQSLPNEFRDWRLAGTFGLWLAGAAIIIEQHSGLTKRRQRVWQALKKLSPEAREIFGEPVPQPTFFGKDVYLPIASIILTALMAFICAYALDLKDLPPS